LPGSLPRRTTPASPLGAFAWRFDIENPFQPREAGFFVPPDPERMFDPRPNRPKVIQSADCFVDAQGVMYLTDNNAGLYVLQFEGA
jgi:hypothetical protein